MILFVVVILVVMPIAARRVRVRTPGRCGVLLQRQVGWHVENAHNQRK